MTDLTYIPRYLIEAEKEEQAQDPKATRQKYARCAACHEFVHVDDAVNHRKMYCDPGHVRKKAWTTRPSPKRIVGGYVLGVGVNPRPIDNPPRQVLRGKCKNCNAVLVLTEDPLCVVCSGRR